MDRVNIQFGALPLDTDMLATNRNAMVGLGVALQALLGPGPNVDGLPCVPGSGLNVNVGPGAIYVAAGIDATPYGSLPADTVDQIVQQGIAFGQTTLAVPAPGTAGQSINYLIEAQFQQVDANPVALLYYNAANPLQPLAGSATDTARKGVCALQVKAGTAAATGTQATPAADAGWSGLYVVTVPYGATSISSGEIALVPGAPFISAKLGSLFQICAGNPNGVLAGSAAVVGAAMASLAYDVAESTLWICTASGSASTAVWSRNAIAQVVAGNPNGNVAGSAGAAGGAFPSMIWDITHAILWICTTSGSAALAVWTPVGAAGSLPFCGTSTGTANAQSIANPPGLLALAAGTTMGFTVGAGLNNTGATTITVGSFGTFAVVKDSPTGPIALTGSELAAGNSPSIRFDGTSLHLEPGALGTASLQNASSATGTVAAVIGSGSIVPGHLAVFSDNKGGIADGGPGAASGKNLYLTGSTNITTGGFDLDSSAGVFTITTAAAPTNGDNFWVKDVGLALAANAVTWNPNGKTVNGNSGNFLFDMNGGYALFSYKNGNWSIQ